jgi:ABC-type Fe3+ transport system permease subunit
MSFTTKLTSALILNLAAQGDWGTSAALAIILTLTIFASLGILTILINPVRRKPAPAMP